MVHGVQRGSDKNLSQDKYVQRLVDATLRDIHLQKDYYVRLFPYEDINNQAQDVFQKVAGAITTGNPLASNVVDLVIDIVGDVVTAARQTDTAKLIQEKLIEQIEKYNQQQRPVVLAAHSLGTVYALDVINTLMARDEYFKGDDRTTWPIWGLVSFGSPLGLKLFSKRKIGALENARYSMFPWYNFWNKLDPVVSGHVFGNPEKPDGYFNGPVEKRYKKDCIEKRWFLQSEVVKSGEQWVAAHSAYWNHPRIGDKIVELLWD